MTRHGLNDATTDENAIRNWWNASPDANIGLNTGGLVVVDLDIVEDQPNPWPNSEIEDLPAVVATTPSGGRHWFFRQPIGEPFRNTASRLAHCVDIRADGGYVVVAPSRTDTGVYEFLDGHDLVPRDQLPETPEWLLPHLRKAAKPRQGSVPPESRPADAVDENGRQPATVEPTPASPIIPEGQRNDYLTRYAGALRRTGATQAEIFAALRVRNAEACRPSLDDGEVARIAQSVAQYEPDKLTLSVIRGLTDAAYTPPAMIRAEDLVLEHSDYRPIVVDQLLRRGEIMNLIAAPKVGKSHLVLDLAMTIAQGGKWLGVFPTTPGRVLIIDNELHRETMAQRLKTALQQRNLTASDLAGAIDVIPSRAAAFTFSRLLGFLANLEPDKYSLIVLDATYRFADHVADENSNRDMAAMYNSLDLHALRLNTAIVLVHHTSKGNQAGKGVTDVGSGAGSQSRAADTHVVLRPHATPGNVVMDAAVRSWPAFPRIVLRHDADGWRCDDSGLDPNDLEGPSSGRRKSSGEGGESMPTSPGWTAERFAEEIVGAEHRTAETIFETAQAVAGMSKREAHRQLQNAVEAGIVHKIQRRKNVPILYGTTPYLEAQSCDVDRTADNPHLPARLQDADGTSASGSGEGIPP